MMKLARTARVCSTNITKKATRRLGTVASTRGASRPPFSSHRGQHGKNHPGFPRLSARNDVRDGAIWMDRTPDPAERDRHETLRLGVRAPRGPGRSSSRPEGRAFGRSRVPHRKNETLDKSSARERAHARDGRVRATYLDILVGPLAEELDLSRSDRHSFRWSVRALVIRGLGGCAFPLFVPCPLLFSSPKNQIRMGKQSERG